MLARRVLALLRCYDDWCHRVAVAAPPRNDGEADENSERNHRAADGDA